MKMKIIRALLLLVVCCIIGLKGFGLDSLMIQHLSVPRAGDIYLIQEPNDSFSFFQIGNVDSTELIPIIKGAYLVKDSFLHERTVKSMDTNFPDYFDTSDIYSVPRTELHKMNREGKIVQIYRNGKIIIRPTDNKMNYSLLFFSIFIALIITAGFICLYYLIIWLCNRGKVKFLEKSNIFRLGIISCIVIFTSIVSVLDNKIPFDYQEFLFFIIRNLGGILSLYSFYQLVNQYLLKKTDFLLRQLLLLSYIIVGGGIIFMIFHTMTVYAMTNKWESMVSLFDYQIYNFTIAFPLYNLIPFGFAHLIYALIENQKRMNLQKKKLAFSQLNEQKTKAELEALTAKTNPHFLYNSLNTIAALAKTDADKTERMAIELSKFLKYSTNRKGINLVPLREEIEMVETYLKIEKIRFEDQLEFQIKVEKSAENQMIPRFLLQPLAENALKHGYEIGTDKIKLAIIAIMEDNQLVLKIKDSGAPFAEDFTAGYGLDSVTKKLHLLFPNRHTLAFLNSPEKQIQIRLQDDPILQD